MRAPLMVAAGAALALVLAGGGFVAGRTLAENDAKAGASATAGRQGARGQGQGQFGQGAGGGNAARALNGQVLSVGDGTITIQLSGQDPTAQGSRIVLVAPSTRVVKTAETDVKLSDLKAGERVTVVGQENADGTVNATAVVEGGNALQNLFGGGAGGARVSPTPSPTR
ncbi:MAG: hypothetical protein E6I87_02720 [Chloroflexi bacterium]|nr:MAG: hypothetical protein E6I87_02720 [Chloroflexota bacterium]